MVKPMQASRSAAAGDLARLLATRLDPVDGPAMGALRGDYDLSPEGRPAPLSELVPAAVLAPIVRRPAGWTMLFTQRAEGLPRHPGQISFPGGRRQPEDRTLLETALRETQEELGVLQALFSPVGAFDPYETGTGFRILPIVAYLEPGFSLMPDPREVADVFEVPFAFLMDPAHHEVRETEWKGAMRRFYAIPYEGRNIWGATAGMIRALYERLYL
jgi:8-oxo-dGTP pyrophosphatase MutT (NUDIX family)